MSQRTGREGEEAYQPHPQRWRILGVTLVIGFMTLLDVTIVNVALPSIREGTGASPAHVQWVVSGYALAFGLTLVAGGRLGDAYGRRRLMLVGLAGFVVSSAAVGLSPNGEAMVAARLAQGTAAGLLTPQTSGLIQQLFRGPERGRAFGYFGTTVSVSAAIGPVLGGAIIALLGEDLGWRAIFLVNVPIGLTAMVFVAHMVPRRAARPDDVGSRVDLPGALLLGAGVLCVLYPLVTLMDGPSPVLLLAVGAPVFFAAFARWERWTVAKGRAPVLDVALLARAPGYGTGILVGTLYFTGFTGVFLVLSVHLQEAMGFSALETGLMLTPFAVGSATSAALAGRWVSVVGRKVTVVSLTLVLTGMVVVAVAVPGRPGEGLWPLLVLPLLLAGIGGGGVVSPNFTLTLADVPPRMGGAAGGALQTGQRIGSATGAALMMTVYQVVLGASGQAGDALRAAMVAAVVTIACAFVLAVVDLRLDARRDLSPRR